MSDSTFSKAIESQVRFAAGESAIRTANVYFHRAHAAAAVELGARLAAEGRGQVFVTRTQGDLVKSQNDIQSCNAVLIDTALGEAQIALIIGLHDNVRYPYEVHRFTYDPLTELFEKAKPNAETAQASVEPVQSGDTGHADTEGPRPSDPPARSTVAPLATIRGRGRTDRSAGGGSQ